MGFGGAVPAEPAIYAPNPDPFQTGPIPRVLTDEMNDFQETEIAGEPNETPGEVLGAAEGVSVAERIVHSEGPTGPWRVAAVGGRRRAMIDILLAGVGGQGTVLAAKVLAQAAQNKGWQVRTAETIGMAQRGGNVTSHVRMGSNGEAVYSPLITPGTADMVIALEPGEAARALPIWRRAVCW